MIGPGLLTRALSIPRVTDRDGRQWQYHSRSDDHSKVASVAILIDLLVASRALRQQIEAGSVCFGFDHEMRDYRVNRKKNLDLVLARPTGSKSGPTIADYASRLRLPLSQPEAELLSSLPTIRQGPVGAVLLALEAKACMTEHIKARPRLYDELNSSHLTIHGDHSTAIAVGFTMINFASTFVSPTNSGKTNIHRQPDVTNGVLSKLAELPRASKSGEEGYDAFGIIVVDCKNDGSPVSLLQASPAPGPDSIFNYERMIDRTALLFDTRFKHA